LQSHIEALAVEIPPIGRRIPSRWLPLSVPGCPAMDLIVPPLFSLELPEIETLSLLDAPDRGGVRGRQRFDTLAIGSLILLGL